MSTVLEGQIELALLRLTDYKRFEKMVARLLDADGRQVEERGGDRDDGVDFVIRERRARGSDRIAYGQVSAQATWERKLRDWLRQVERFHPEAENLVFVTTRPVSSRRKEALPAEFRDRFRIEILDRSWLTRMLLGNPRIAREYLDIAALEQSVFLLPGEYRRALVARTFSRHFGQLAPMVGREEGLQRLEVLLAGEAGICEPADVVLIVGSGGVGKSRLALEASRSRTSWAYVQPDREVTEAALLDLPEHGEFVLVLDDPHREPNDRSVRFLRTLLDRTRPGRTLRLVLTTRPAHRDTVLSLLQPRGSLRIATLELPPLPRAVVDEILKGPPFHVGSETARALIVGLARGLPSIAEAAVQVFRSGGGIGALQTGDAVWSLVDGELGSSSEELRRIQAGLDRPRAELFVGILAAFETFPWDRDDALEALYRSARLGENEAIALREHLARSGILQESNGGGVAIKPDILAESAIRHVFFPETPPTWDYAELVWKPFAPQFEARLLKRLGALRPPTDALRAFIAEEMSEVPRTIAASDNAERRRLLEQLTPIAPLAPDLILEVARTVLEKPAPDHEDTVWGITVTHTSTETVDVLVGILRDLLQTCPASSPRHGEALDLLLLATEKVPGHGYEDLEGSGFRGDRLAARLLCNLARLDWQWEPERPPDFERSRRDLERFRAWFLQQPKLRGRLFAVILQEAAQVDLHSLLPAARNKDTFRMVRHSVRRDPDTGAHLAFLAQLWLDLFEHADTRARFMALDPLDAVLSGLVDRDPGTPGGSDAVEENLDDLLTWLATHSSLFNAPAKLRLLAILDLLAGLPSRGSDKLAALANELRRDEDVVLYGNLRGRHSRCEGRLHREVDWAEEKRRHDEWLQGWVTRLASGEVPLSEFLDRAAGLNEQATLVGVAPPSHLGHLLFDLGQRSVEIAKRTVEILAGRHAGTLCRYLPFPLQALWLTDPRMARHVTGRLLSETNIDVRKAAAIALATENPEEGQVELALEISNAGEELVQRAFLASLRLLRDDASSRWTGVLLTLGRQCAASLLPTVLESLRPPGCKARLPYADFEVAPEREKDYLDVVRRLLALPKLTSDDHLEESLRFYCRKEPAEFLKNIEARIQQGRQPGRTLDPLPDVVEAVLRDLPDDERRRLVATWVDRLHAGDLLAKDVLRAVLDRQGCDELARGAAASVPEVDLRLLRVVLPRSSRACFDEVLAKVVTRLDRRQGDEILSLITEYHGLTGQFHAGPQLPAWDAVAAEVSTWEQATDARLRDFARWAKARLRAAGRSLHAYELDEYDFPG